MNPKAKFNKIIIKRRFSKVYLNIKLLPCSLFKDETINIIDLELRSHGQID